MSKTHYETLGLKADASQDDIKHAFKKLALESHPDRNPGDERSAVRFKEVNEAHQVLSDETKRVLYDESLKPPKPRINFRTSPFGSPFGAGIPDDFFANIPMDPFADVFKTARAKAASASKNAHPAPDPGDDMTVTVTVPMDEALAGAKKTVRFKNGVTTPCNRCRSSGAEPGSGRTICATCGGNGRVPELIAGRPAARNCRTCSGSGGVYLRKCSECSGAGKVDVAREIAVTVPRGLRNGQGMRVRGLGKPGQPPGDLIVNVEVSDSPDWWARGEDLFTYSTTDLFTLVGGGVAQLHIPDGRVLAVPVPAGGGMSRVAGAWKNPGGRDGDIVVLFKVRTGSLGVRGERLVKELIEELSGPVRPR